MYTIHVVELIGTPNAILHPFGMEVYHKAKLVLQTEAAINLDLSGIRNVTSAFFHASVGNLFNDLKEDFFTRVKIVGAEDRPDWQEKIQDSIELIRHPSLQLETQQEVAALFEF